jgi:cytochrome oxidase assembly protein ShyY1
MRFLLSRRWLLFGAAVAVLAIACWNLGEWQFSRYETRVQRNDYARANYTKDPVPVDQVLSPDEGITRSEEWTRVQLTGTYDQDASLQVRYQSRDGVAGVDVVTPLVRADGTGVLVDRGWFETQGRGDHLDALPAPPAGDVTVVGWVRPDTTGDSTKVIERSVRTISSRTIGADLDYPLLQGYVAAQSESPEALEKPAPNEPPELGEGPHFFYGMQWWFFGVLALFGFGYLAYDERRKMRDASRTPARDSPAADRV